MLRSLWVLWIVTFMPGSDLLIIWGRGPRSMQLHLGKTLKLWLWEIKQKYEGKDFNTVFKKKSFMWTFQFHCTKVHELISGWKFFNICEERWLGISYKSPPNFQVTIWNFSVEISEYYSIHMYFPYEWCWKS